MSYIKEFDVIFNKFNYWNRETFNKVKNEIIQCQSKYSNKTFLEITTETYKKMLSSEIKKDVVDERELPDLDYMYLQSCVELKRGNYLDEANIALINYFETRKIARGDFVNTWHKIVAVKGYVSTCFNINSLYSRVYYDAFNSWDSAFTENIEKIIFLITHSVNTGRTNLFYNQLKAWSGFGNYSLPFNLEDIKLFKQAIENLYNFSLNQYSYKFLSKDDWVRYFSQL